MHKQRGFTIIELLIVLALAGLMVLVVFLAVPALQRASRNNIRHKDASLLLAAIVDVRTQSSNGSLPDSCDTTQASCFLKDVPLAYYKESVHSESKVSFVKLDHEFVDGDALLHEGDDDVTEKVVLYSYANCNETGTAPTGLYASPQSVAAQYAIETYNGVAWQCKQV